MQIPVLLSGSEIPTLRVIFKELGGHDRRLMQISNKYQVMPPLSQEEFQAHKESIAENGVLVPVVIDVDGAIIDGHYRVQAYHELFAEGNDVPMYPTETRSDLTTDAEKRELAWRLNMQRRHLSQAQKRDAIDAKLKESPEWADNRIAKLLGADSKTVRVRRVMLEKRGEIPKLDKLVGADLKAYPREVVNKPKERVPVSSTKRPPSPGAGATVLTRQKVKEPFRWPNAAPTPSPQVQPFASWSDEERELLAAFRAGESIVVNMHEDGPHKHLVPWLVDTNQLTRADRKTEWGNPFIEGEDGNRETVVRLYEEHYLPYKLGLKDKLSKMESPTAWGCWCAPQPCHCDVLKRVAEGGSSAEPKVEG
jgi:DNA primase